MTEPGGSTRPTRQPGNALAADRPHRADRLRQVDRGRLAGGPWRRRGRRGPADARTHVARRPGHAGRHRPFRRGVSPLRRLPRSRRPGPPRLLRRGTARRTGVRRPSRRRDAWLPDAIRAADATRPVAIVLEAIKLVEAGSAPWCDEIWLVVCDPDRSARPPHRPWHDRTPTPASGSRPRPTPCPCGARPPPESSPTDGAPAEVELAVDAALREALAAHAERGEPSRRRKGSTEARRIGG